VNSVLTVAIMDKSGASEQMIGETSIDVEDRWFHPLFQKMLAESASNHKLFPIETRPLRQDGSFLTQGLLRVWFEIMNMKTHQQWPIEQLVSADPEPFQLRLVIWQVKEVMKQEGEDTIHIQVKCCWQYSAEHIEAKETDTHYGSADGLGRFNWRMIFDIQNPHPFPSIKVQLLSVNTLSVDTVAECTIDLQHDMAKAKRTKNTMANEKCWVKLTHPSAPGKVRGMVELELKILPDDDARANPVGQGREYDRDHPNTDPFCDPDDNSAPCYMVKHRNYLANTAAGQMAKDVAEGAQKFAMLSMILTTLGSAASFLVVVFMYFATR